MKERCGGEGEGECSSSQPSLTSGYEGDSDEDRWVLQEDGWVLLVCCMCIAIGGGGMIMVHDWGGGGMIMVHDWGRVV